MTECKHLLSLGDTWNFIKFQIWRHDHIGGTNPSKINLVQWLIPGAVDRRPNKVSEIASSFCICANYGQVDPVCNNVDCICANPQIFTFCNLCIYGIVVKPQRTGDCTFLLISPPTTLWLSSMMKHGTGVLRLRSLHLKTDQVLSK
jgi:hypothetical protein